MIKYPIMQRKFRNFNKFMHILKLNFRIYKLLMPSCFHKINIFSNPYIPSKSKKNSLSLIIINCPVKFNNYNKISLLRINHSLNSMIFVFNFPPNYHNKSLIKIITSQKSLINQIRYNFLKLASNLKKKEA